MADRDKNDGEEKSETITEEEFIATAGGQNSNGQGGRYGSPFRLFGFLTDADAAVS